MSGTQLLPSGGTVTATTTGSVGTSDVEGVREQDAAMSGTVSLTQPLLRGAFHGVAFEPLKLADRGVVYAARDFEQFRQRFSIQVIAQYYGLVSQKIALQNTERRVANQEFALRQARSLYRLELGPQADVLRAEQTFRSAQNDLLDARQGYELALDRFKIQLGLPLDVEFDVAAEIPPLDPLEVDVRGAVEAALHNRLDLLTVRDQLDDSRRALDVARNALLPDLDVDLSYSIFSDTDMSSFRNLAFDSDTVSLGVTLGLPLDRKAERNALRSAMIGLDRARRGLDLAEDNVILEVRDSLRRLRQLQAQIENDQANIEVIERRVRRAVLDNLAGVGSNRDIVEATDDLTAAQNGLLGRFVEHLTTRLQLLQQMGLLFVDKQGRIVE